MHNKRWCTDLPLTSHPWRGGFGGRAAAPSTYRAFPGTPPASGSGSPGRTWPLRTPAAPEAATWAASWLWAAPSNHPERDLVSPCSEEETLKIHARTHAHARTDTHTHTATTLITKRLSVCAWPSSPLCVCVCGYLPLFKSSDYLKRDVFMLSLVISSSRFPIAERRAAAEISPECGFVAPGCGSRGTSYCRLRPPCSAVLSRPVCSPPHHRGRTISYYHPGHWMYQQSTIQLRLSIRRLSLSVQSGLDSFHKRTRTWAAGVAVL